MSFRKRGRDQHGNDGRNKRGGRGGYERRPHTTLSPGAIEKMVGESKLCFDKFVLLPETSELDVGISCFRSTLPGFSGILKQRYSDFLVNEITPEGEVLHLTPPNFIEPVDPASANNNDSAEARLTRLVGEDKTKEFLAWFQTGKETLGERRQARKQQRQAEAQGTPVVKKDSAPIEPFVFELNLEKQARTELHTVLKEYGGISTDTAEGGKKAGSGDANAPRYVRAHFGNSQHFIAGGAGWPPHWPQYAKFVLYKENLDTMGAITQICNVLRVTPKNFSFAGTKDKRAVTVQHVTAFKIAPERLLQAPKAISNISIGKITLQKQGLKLGDLSGNRFTIVLRDCMLRTPQERSCEALIEATMEELKTSGFINYFGLQRFGSGAPTHVIGKLLLQNNFDAAFAHLIAHPTAQERADITEARKYFVDTRDAQGALDKFPPWLYVERSLLQGLLLNGPNSFTNAFQKIPRSTRSMYGHAYQSHVWNHMVSLRLTLLDPMRVVEGDLILPQEDRLEEEVPDDEDAPSTWKLPEPTLVTKQEAEEGKYSIWDVVLPLPGTDVQYPAHIIQDKYREFMAADSINESSFATSKLKELCLAGGYRKILARPKELTWSLHHYTNPEEQVVPTDRDLLNNPEPLETKGDKLALCLKFSLSSATYATMCVREVLKSSTSTTAMSALNNASREPQGNTDESEETLAS